MIVKANRLTNKSEDRFERERIFLQVVLAKLKLNTPGIQANVNPFATNVPLLYPLKIGDFLMFSRGMEVEYRLHMS